MLLETNIMFKVSFEKYKEKKEKRCGEYQVFSLKVLREGEKEQLYIYNLLNELNLHIGSVLINRKT